ncbi:MAG: hypothetical protein KDA33_11425 [Phycisphaerales bacterium]|nr:hypothetical protein [Phycisphaerales bacterium]
MGGNGLRLLATGVEAKDGSGAWGKFTFFNFQFGWPEIRTDQYTIAAAIIANPRVSVYCLGTDQRFVQHMFCCKGASQARWALISSFAGQLVALTVAFGAQLVAAKYKSILALAMAMIGYTGGPLLAGFFLAFLPLRMTGRGDMWAAPLSVLFVFAAVWRQDWAFAVCLIGGGLILTSWLVYTFRGASGRGDGGASCRRLRCCWPSH